MTIKIRYFARVRDALGRSEDDIEAAAGEDAAGLIERLASAAPSAAETLRHPSIRVEINGVIGPKTAAVHDGDEVAILPPFSGG
ncbi:MAG: MoaD/ThiS family protein [Maricaulaceae bacterium]